MLVRMRLSSKPFLKTEVNRFSVDTDTQGGFCPSFQDQLVPPRLECMKKGVYNAQCPLETHGTHTKVEISESTRPHRSIFVDFRCSQLREPTAQQFMRRNDPIRDFNLLFLR